MNSIFTSLNTFLKGVDVRLEQWIRSWNPYDPSHLKERDIQPVKVEESQIRKNFTRWIFGAMFVFLIWGLFAPIDGGVGVNGSVIVSGYRKSVQHPTGGVVNDILVKDGDFVRQGDTLIKINPLNTEANLVNAELQYINLLVTEARLKVERFGKSDILWGDELAHWKNDPRMKEAQALQLELLKSRRQEHANQIAGLQAQLAGLRSSIAARKIQLETLREELANNKKLSQEGFVPQSVVNSILRTKVEMESNLASAMADLGKVQAQIAQQQTAYHRDIDNQLSETQKNRAAFQSRFEAAQFDRMQTEIKAPVNGQVVGLKVFTVGGVIQAGAVLMEIVPHAAHLIAEVQVPTHLIDKVHAGLNADIRFPAFNQTTTPTIPGVVKLVGADKQASNDKQGDFYLTQIEITKAGLALLDTLKIQPGMPVDVMIKTGERNFFSYLLKPLTDKFAKAFKN